MYYAKSTNGFYTRDIHGENMPADVVEITAEEHAALMDGQSNGKLIDFDEAGRPFLAEPPPPTAEQILSRLEARVQSWLDEQAQALGYDDITSAVTYAEEPAEPKFQLEGRGFRAWRSMVWAYTYEQLQLVNNGEREQPTIADFILELPELVIPEPEPIQEPVAEEPAPTDTTNEGTPV